MADQVTSSIEKSPEQIEREMLATRESLTEKVAALETQVVGTVQNAADTISDTVESVKTMLSGAPEAVSDSVKQATTAVSDAAKEMFDITGHVRRNPLVAVGVSALVGGLVGYLTGGGSRRFVELASPAPVPPAAPSYAASTASRAESKPGVIDEFMDMLGDKAKEMARTALESVSAAIKQNIETGVPKLVDDAASRLTDAGKPASSFDARRSRA